MSWLTDPLRYEFVRVAILAALLTGLTCAILGVYVVQRRMAFIGDAMAHTVLPGIAIAYLLGWNLSLGALIAGLVTALGIGVVARRNMVKEDTAIGVFFTGMFALGVLIMNAAPSGNKDLSHMLLGHVLGVTNEDLLLIAGIFVLVVIALALFHKELELTSFDPVHAQVIGMRPELMRYTLLFLLALTVVTSIQCVGVVLTASLLVTPAAAASLLTTRFSLVMAISAIIASASALIGFYVSYHFNQSSGASIVLCCTAFFAIAWLLQVIRRRFRLAEENA